MTGICPHCGAVAALDDSDLTVSLGIAYECGTRRHADGSTVRSDACRARSEGLRIKEVAAEADRLRERLDYYMTLAAHRQKRWRSANRITVRMLRRDHE